MARALRPWTIDFHVAQNDGTVKGSGSHDKTGRHCPPNDPNGKLDIVRDAGAWMRDDNEKPTQGVRAYLLGRVHVSERSNDEPPNLERCVARDAGCARCARLGLEHVGQIMKKLNIAVVGCGFMGRTHSNAFRKVANFFDTPYRPVLKTHLRAQRRKGQAFADRWGFEAAVTDWRTLIDDKDVDLIDIASPNDTHAEIAAAAAKAGKMVMCEKPLGRNPAESEAMIKAVEDAKVANMVWYNYRRVPAVTLAKQLIDEGRLGRIFHYRTVFLQDWTISSDLPQGGEGLWRLDASVAGSGVTGDLLAHNIDTAMWLNGGIDEVTAMTETFIKTRKHNLTGKDEPVNIDDASAFLARFQEWIVSHV